MVIFQNYVYFYSFFLLSAFILLFFRKRSSASSNKVNSSLAGVNYVNNMPTTFFLSLLTWMLMHVFC